MRTRFGLTERRLHMHLADRCGLTRRQVQDIFTELEHLAANELKRTGEFVIPGVTKLAIEHRTARIGRHPWTGVPIRIQAKTTLKARPKERLRDQVMARPKPGRS